MLDCSALKLAPTPNPLAHYAHGSHCVQPTLGEQRVRLCSLEGGVCVGHGHGCEEGREEDLPVPLEVNVPSLFVLSLY